MTSDIIYYSNNAICNQNDWYTVTPNPTTHSTYLVIYDRNLLFYTFTFWFVLLLQFYVIVFLSYLWLTSRRLVSWAQFSASIECNQLFYRERIILTNDQSILRTLVSKQKYTNKRLHKPRFTPIYNTTNDYFYMHSLLPTIIILRTDGLRSGYGFGFTEGATLHMQIL